MVQVILTWVTFLVFEKPARFAFYIPSYRVRGFAFLDDKEDANARTGVKALLARQGFAFDAGRGEFILIATRFALGTISVKTN